jgi:hypothetical protein
VIVEKAPKSSAPNIDKVENKRKPFFALFIDVGFGRKSSLFQTTSLLESEGKIGFCSLENGRNFSCSQMQIHL